MRIFHFSKLLKNALLVLVFSMMIVSQLNYGASQARAQASTAPVQIRWFIGLGTGENPDQVTREQEVADDFNASHPNIQLNLEVVPNASGRDTLRAEITNGNAPDLVGPVGWAGSNSFHGLWLDLASLISSTSFDTSIFDPALVNMYKTADEGQVALPFAVYPSAIYYNPVLFTAAGLNLPPAHYGDLYEMPDHSMVVWSWDTLAQVAKLLTLDSHLHNATDSKFDPNDIAQYGFAFGWQSHPNYVGSYWQAGSLLHGSAGSYTAQIPDAWKAAWQWYYDGMWGAQLYIPTGPVAGSHDFDYGNPFASGKVAMLENPSWYLNGTGDLTNAGGTFQFGAMPSYNGSVAGRVDADTFRILKASSHPDEAFTVLTYLITTGVDKLIVGTTGKAPAYGGALSAITAKQAAWQATLATNFPFVTSDSWSVLLAGLNYPDVPSAEGFMPNQIESWNCIQDFGNLLAYNEGVDLAAVEPKLEGDLTTIFNTTYLLISGNAGVEGVTLSYHDGSDKTTTSTSDGSYALTVSSGWSGTVTPSKTGFAFKPPYLTYTYVLMNKIHQDYTALHAIYLPLVKRFR